MTICDSAPGLPARKRRGLVPAVHALQIEAAAEGRAEGGECQQADGQRIGAHVLDQLPRHQRAQRYPEQQQHGLRQDRRQRQRPPGQRRAADRKHGAGNQPARQSCPQKQQAAGGADDERLQRGEDMGAVGNGRRHRCGDQGHAALWQIRHEGDKCATRLQQCARLAGFAGCAFTLPEREGEGCCEDFLVVGRLATVAGVTAACERRVQVRCDCRCCCRRCCFRSCSRLRSQDGNDDTGRTIRCDGHGSRTDRADRPGQRRSSRFGSNPSAACSADRSGHRRQESIGCFQFEPLTRVASSAGAECAAVGTEAAGRPHRRR